MNLGLGQRYHERMMQCKTHQGLTRQKLGRVEVPDTRRVKSVLTLVEPGLVWSAPSILLSDICHRNEPVESSISGNPFYSYSFCLCFFLGLAGTSDSSFFCRAFWSFSFRTDLSKALRFSNFFTISWPFLFSLSVYPSYSLEFASEILYSHARLRV